MKRIFLIGFMAAGKTTLGKAYAKSLGLAFIDLDQYIEQRRCKSISQLFAELGEDGFRILEQKYLHEVADIEDVVISCGGGTPCFFDNMEYINSHGVSVFLQVTPQVLMRRLLAAKAKRPLVAQKSNKELEQYIETTLAFRMPFYTRAKYTFDGSRLESHAQINEAINALKILIN